MGIAWHNVTTTRNIYLGHITIININEYIMMRQDKTSTNDREMEMYEIRSYQQAVLQENCLTDYRNTGVSLPL